MAAVLADEMVTVPVDKVAVVMADGVVYKLVGKWLCIG